MMTSDTLDTPLLTAAMQLIWHEAELLDRKNYKGWLDLWTTDGFYVVPIDQETTDFAATLNYIYDDHTMRGLRVERMSGGFSASASDSAQTVRTISRFVEVDAGVANPDAPVDTIKVRSAQIILASKRGVMTLFGANLTHRIVIGDNGLRIADKVVRLIDSADALPAIGFLL